MLRSFPNPMKKFIALVLTLALAVSLCACSSKAGSHDGDLHGADGRQYLYLYGPG